MRNLNGYKLIKKPQQESAPEGKKTEEEVKAGNN